MTTIERIDKTIKMATGIMNNYLMKEDYATAGCQQAYIDGMETAKIFLEIDPGTAMIVKFMGVYADHVADKKNNEDWFGVAEFQQKIRAFSQVKVWMDEEEED